MAAGWPTKVSYANGDVFSSSDINDTNGTLNYIDPTSASDGQVLTRDNASGGKVKWAAAATTLIKRATFSAVANTGTTFDGVFSSTYKSYLLVIEGFGAATTTDDVHLQWRYAGPTTETGAIYYGNVFSFSYGSGATTNNNQAFVAQAILSYNAGAVSTTSGAGSYNIFNVGVQGYPKLIGGYTDSGAAESAESYIINQGNRTYTGFLLKSSSSNITGTVAVYGLA